MFNTLDRKKSFSLSVERDYQITFVTCKLENITRRIDGVNILPVVLAVRMTSGVITHFSAVELTSARDNNKDRNFIINPNDARDHPTAARTGTFFPLWRPDCGGLLRFGYRNVYGQWSSKRNKEPNLSGLRGFFFFFLIIQSTE